MRASLTHLSSPALGAHGLALAASLVAGCHARVEAPRSSASALPPFVVATRRTVLRAPDDRSLRLATPRATLPLRVRELRGREAWVELGGGLEVTGVVTLETLGVRVCEAGPLDDRWYLGNGNTLELRSTVHDGAVRVAGTVTVRAKAHQDKMPLAEQFRAMTFEGTVPVARLCSAQPPKRHAGTADDPEVSTPWGEPNIEDFPSDARVVELDKETPHAILDAPNGAPLHTLPAEPWSKLVIRVRREGSWNLVAVGGGPYLLGWVPSRTPEGDDARSRADVFGVGGLGLRGAFDGRVPLALNGRRFRGWAIHRLGAGTVLQQLGKPRARLTRDGFARVSPKTSGARSFVVAAVDDDATAEGWIETAKLGERGVE